MARNNARSTESSSVKSAEPPPPVAVVSESAPAAEPASEPAPEASPESPFLLRAITTSFSTLRTAQSAALQRYAAWILELEAITTKSLATAETFLLGTFKLKA
jgi:hypothetical protein